MRAGLPLLLVACGRVGFDATGDAVLPCTDICECTVDDDCTAPHRYCDVHGSSRTCDCVAGYADTGGACTWVGVVADPGFQQPTAWTLTGGTIDPALSEGGMVDFGAANLDALSRVGQTITMPRLSRAELLVVQVSSRGTQNGDQPTVLVGAHWYDLAGKTTWNIARRCLGAAHYAPESSTGKGVAMPLQIMPVRVGSTLHVDRVEILPANAGECVMPGPIANGDAETDAGWTFLARPANGPDATTAGFAAGRGANNSRAARLFVAERCDLASFTMQASLPGVDQIPSPAISFYNQTTTGAASEIDAPVPSLIAGTGAAATIVQCVPSSQRGETFALAGVLNPVGGCSQVLNYEAIFDSIAVMNEPACGTDGVADPGFETGALPQGTSFEPGFTTVSISNVAHSGTSALKLAATHPCYSSSYELSVTVPPTSPAGGPALELFYRSTPVGTYTFTAQVLGGASAAITQDNTWRRGVLCFDPRLVGREVAVQLAMPSGSGTCAQVIPEESTLLDDLALTNDASCPM
jgi:hypothetical protein